MWIETNLRYVDIAPSENLGINDLEFREHILRVYGDVDVKGAYYT